MNNISVKTPKIQKTQVSVNLQINQLRDRLRKARSRREAQDLLTFFIEASEEGSVKNWLIEFQRIFNAFGPQSQSSTGGAR